MQRVDEADIFLVHIEAENIAPLAAAEAMKRLAGSIHVKRRSLFLMERAQPLVGVGSGALELYKGSDQLDNVAPGADVLNDIFGDAEIHFPRHPLS